MQRNAVIGVKVHSRILLITGISQCTSQYMMCMNVFFTAQKLGIVLDVCVLDKSLSLLQQGCDITGGQYLHLTQLDGFLQYLLWVYLPDPQLRRKLVLPPPKKVDYRAACFCHHELIDIGYVCSVCLSSKFLMIFFTLFRILTLIEIPQQFSANSVLFVPHASKFR